MSKFILYIGNQLSNQTGKFTYMEGLAQLLEKEGFQVHMSSKAKNQALRLLVMLWSVLRFGPSSHVVLIDTYSTTAFWYAFLSARLCQLLRLDYVPVLHGGNLPLRLAQNPKLCQQLFSNAKVNVAPSAYLMDHFQKAGYTNITYIPNTIDLEKYAFKHRENLQPKLLWVRSFAHIYNPILALKLLEQLLAFYPEAQLSMVGPFKDDSIKDCQAYAKDKSLPVTFTGGMPKESWLAYAKDFDLFINTTNVDNTPVSVIEAMALGLPVVTTNVGGIPFLIDDEKEALLVPPNDVHAMLNAILKLLGSPETSQSLSRNARLKVQDFDWEVVKQHWFEVIDQ